MKSLPASLSGQRRRISRYRTLWMATSMTIVLGLTWSSICWTIFQRRRQTMETRDQTLRASSVRRYASRSIERNTYMQQTKLRRQLMLPGTMTYTNECQSRYLYNDTWGKLHAPWADKVQAKILLEALYIDGLKIPRTLALFNATTMKDLTVRDLQRATKSLPSNFIIKPAHTSGAVARVVNGSRYSCFKKCHYPAEDAPLPEAYDLMLQNMQYSMAHMHSNPSYERATKGRQLQYQHIPKQIVVEEHLDVDLLKEWHWWVGHGQVVFVCLRCGNYGSYYSSRFQTLNMSQGLLACPDPPTRPPKSWSNMLRVVKEIGKHVPGVIRLDLYASDTDETIYFSEVTFTSTSCSVEMDPIVADALLYAVLYRNLTVVSPQFVEQTINDRPCVEVEATVSHWWTHETNQTERQLQRHRQHASPTDLCRDLAPDDSSMCVNQTRHVAAYPLQCIAVDRNSTLSLQAIGQYRDTSWRNVMARVDWPWAIALAVVILLLRYCRIGEKQASQHWNVLAYLSLMAVYKWQSTYNDGLFSPDSLWTTIVQSYQVFVMVHPLHSYVVALTHVATYWFEIAAWRARTLQNMLGWYLMFELVASFVNEYSHHQEADDGVRCMRVLFVQTMKQYAVDDIVRAYLCAPFLVYGVLLPKLVLAHVYWPTAVLVMVIGVVMRLRSSKARRGIAQGLR